MSKNYVLTVLLISILFMGAYLVWTTWITPRPTVASDVPQQSTAAKITPSANITIVPATLNNAGIPAKLSTLSLTQTMTGPDALAEFAQLHGKGFDLLGGYMAHYGKDQALLWVGQAKDNAAAQTMLDEMAQKIGPDNAMFKDLQPLDISGRTLYSAVGQGQQHFFYAVNDKIVWLAADAEQAPDALHSLWSAVK
ncbi:MAG: hypothetical protein HY782_08080 [Chloroflexi bacterium]|nr:hypothetical protein [Chloroflexota bacterium]